MQTIDEKILTADYRISDDDRDFLKQEFLKVDACPYREYEKFRASIKEIVAKPAAENMVGLLGEVARRDQRLRPFVFVENSPIDDVLPDLDFKAVAQSKRERKKTYVSEGFLTFYDLVSDAPAVAYLNVNEADIYHDIHPQEDLKGSQSQKSLLTLGFHTDLVNHFVRPDFVNIVSLRSCDDNEIFTTFASNHELLKTLDDDEVELLRQKQFYTPFDDLTTYGAKVDVGRAQDHAVLNGENHIIFFEKRTVGHTPEAQALVEKINIKLHDVKKMKLMRPGDFVSIANNHTLHAKEVREIRKPSEQYRRWSMKTINVESMAPHERHLVAGSNYIING